MEIAKFVITCVLAACTVGGVFAGIWKGYKKKMDDRIAATESEASAAVQAARDDAKEKTEDVKKEASAALAVQEKRIDKLENSVAALQSTITNDFGQRLGNIEGEMKGMNNILKSIQNWFITNTPRS